MKLEEVNLKTKEAVDYLVQSLEAGQSSVLTQYLGAMAKFRNYSFGNIMLIARQKPEPPTLQDSALGTRLAASSGVAKRAFSFSPQWSATSAIDDENAEQNTDAKETERTLYGFRGVYVFDRLSRDLRPSLCALDVIPECHFRKSPR